MSAIDDTFAEARRDGRKLLLPFLTAGDPDLAFTAELLTEIAARGAGIIEVGIPYSDPIADGPVIQASYQRALNTGIRLEAILGTLSTVAPRLGVPLVTMVSYAIVHRHGPAQYVGAARAAGVAGLIVPDLPVEESASLLEPCTAAGLSLIQLVTPTTPRERAVRIAATTTGFLYYVSVTGITGERSALPHEVSENVTWLRKQTDLPICIGFGISQAEHVRTLAPVADGLIVGSALVRRVAETATRSRAEVRQEVGRFVAELVASLNG